ncbi:NAD-glutamate dehydrogenase [Pedomonas mirosovicensis]|uniref:NAD-glutamate dehydrogenase n=1 Tax=Pedomonas mirosovicensis TaxID=2908641 RepID=UPI002167A6AE|nr:NAD-glutamate dehydrogenase [Pedomonas mirosovicensis]
MPERDKLLEEMTDNVASIVLRDNYLQTQALSVAELGGVHAVPAYARLIQTLEASGHLNRAVEGLPSDEELDRRIAAGEGLTRPELAVLLAYSKLRLYEALLASDVLDDPVMTEDLVQAFPEQLQQRFGAEIRNHPLRRELIATKLSNAIVNRGGIPLAFELAEETGAGLDQVVGAFVVAREVFNTRALWRLIDSYDYRIAADVQIGLHREAASALKRQIEDILRFSGEGMVPSSMIARLKPGIERLIPQVEDLLRPEPRAMVEQYRQVLQERGTPPDVEQALLLLVVLNGGVGVALLAEELGKDEADIAHAYTLLGDRLGLDWAAGMASSLMPADPWERLLIAGTAHDFERVRLDLIRRLVQAGDGASAQDIVAQWLDEQEACANRIRALVANVRASKPATTAKLTHLASQVRQQLAH